VWAKSNGRAFYHAPAIQACLGCDKNEPGFELRARGSLVWAAPQYGDNRAQTMKNIVILISGSGSNMAAIVRAAEQGRWGERLNAHVAMVLSNRADAAGLRFAKDHGMATAVLDHKGFASREAFDEALMAEIDRFEPALVVLAGFMRILTPAFVAHYEGRLLNIHPSLLPAFPGLNTHQRALDAGCQFAGATVHQVTAELDHGRILAQAVVPVLAGDTAESLAARVLTQEHLIYPRAVAQFLAARP
jgi:phosphoribosylglycinamide formyltransferase 1